MPCFPKSSCSNVATCRIKHTPSSPTQVVAGSCHSYSCCSHSLVVACSENKAMAPVWRMQENLVPNYESCGKHLGLNMEPQNDTTLKTPGKKNIYLKPPKPPCLTTTTFHPSDRTLMDKQVVLDHRVPPQYSRWKSPLEMPTVHCVSSISDRLPPAEPKQNLAFGNYSASYHEVRVQSSYHKITSGSLSGLPHGHGAHTPGWRPPPVTSLIHAGKSMETVTLIRGKQTNKKTM